MVRFFRLFTAVLAFIAAVPLNSKAQLSLGAGLSPGLGWLRSSQLKQAGNDLQDQSGAIQFDYRSRAAFQLGFHLVAQYRLTHQLSLLAYPGININRSTYNSTYIDHAAVSGDDYLEHKIVSIARFKSTQLQLPIVAKYYIIPDKNYFATAGFCFSFNSKYKMYSEEDSITAYYKQGELYTSNKLDYEYKNIKLDEYKPFQMHMILGVGTSVLTGYRHNLDLEISYYIPLTSSYYYTTNAEYSSQALLNGVFTADGKTALENASGKSLNHFRGHMLKFTVRYLIFSKVN